MHSQNIFTLTIDQGNSSAKAVVWKGSSPVDALRADSLSIEELVPLFEHYDISGAAFCSVAHKDAKFLETLRRLVDGNLVVLTPSLPLPIGIRYSSRESLGSDRVAAAVGAMTLFPGEALLVVDAGTAITIDFLDAEGNFLGGNIAPGMNLRFEALSKATSRLPFVDPVIPLPDFGTDTVSAIRCGIMRGMAAEIADAFSLAADRFGAGKIVITGADAEYLMPLLTERSLIVERDKALVGRGLNRIFQFNTTD